MGAEDYDLGRHDERISIDPLLAKIEKYIQGPLKGEIVRYREKTKLIAKLWQEKRGVRERSTYR